jgi:hypothetical protein
MPDLHRQLSELQQQLYEIQKRLEDRASTECVFVIGCPRSGTSVLSWALAQHPAYWTSSESNFLYKIVAPGAGGTIQLRQTFDKANAISDGWLRTNGVSYEEFASAIGYGFDRLFSSRSLGRRWVDSSPENLLVAEELAIMFPASRFVHVVRDGRAVVASMLESGFQEAWAKDFRTACKTWVHYVKKGLAFEAAHPDRVLRVRNETMAEDCDRMFDFLDVFRHPAAAAFLKTTRVNSSYGNVRPSDIKVPKTADKRPAVEPWKRWTDEMHAQFMDIAGHKLRRLGYVSESQRNREGSRRSTSSSPAGVAGELPMAAASPMEAEPPIAEAESRIEAEPSGEMEPAVEAGSEAERGDRS